MIGIEQAKDEEMGETARWARPFRREGRDSENKKSRPTGFLSWGRQNYCGLDSLMAGQLLDNFFLLVHVGDF